MVEEKKEVEEKKNEGGGREEKKEAEKKEEEKPQELVIKVDMHCEACARKVARSLKGFEGVEEVIASSKASKVVVKGKNADPLKVCERIQKKTGRKVELILPLPVPTPPEDQKKEETKEEPKQEEMKKEEPPAVVTIVLKVAMHCEACAQVLQKRIRKIPVVETATADLANEQVTVKGVVDPEQLVNYVYKRTKKQASIVKNEEKKEDEKKEEAKKEEKEGEKKDGEEDKGEDDTKLEIRKIEHYAYPQYHMEYAYPPQFFSDENPNACSVM